MATVRPESSSAEIENAAGKGMLLYAHVVVYAVVSEGGTVCIQFLCYVYTERSTYVV